MYLNDDGTLDLAQRLNVMRIGGPTADGRVFLGGSMSNEEWVALQGILLYKGSDYWVLVCSCPPGQQHEARCWARIGLDYVLADLEDWSLLDEVERRGYRIDWSGDE